MSLVEKVAAMEQLHERLIDLAACEGEAIQIAISREACRSELIGRRSDFPLPRLHIENVVTGYRPLEFTTWLLEQILLQGPECAR